MNTKTVKTTKARQAKTPLLTSNEIALHLVCGVRVDDLGDLAAQRAAWERHRAEAWSMYDARHARNPNHRAPWGCVAFDGGQRIGAPAFLPTNPDGEWD